MMRQARQAQRKAAVCVPLMARQLFRHSGGIVLQAVASSAVLAMLSAVSSVGRARAFHVAATTAFRCSRRTSCGPLSAYGGGGLASSTQLTTASTRNIRSTTVAAMATAASSRTGTGRGRNSKVRMVSAVSVRQWVPHDALLLFYDVDALIDAVFFDVRTVYTTSERRLFLNTW